VDQALSPSLVEQQARRIIMKATYSRLERAQMIDMMLDDGDEPTDVAVWLRREFGLSFTEAAREVLSQIERRRHNGKMHPSVATVAELTFDPRRD
jgi:hypothetical protein